MDTFTKLCAAGLLGTICVLLLRRGAPELGMLLSLLLAGAAVMFGLKLMSEVMEFLGRVAQMAGLPEEWLNPVYKTVGISVMAKLSADLIRDSGQNGVASAVEMAGVMAALAAALPLLNAMLKMLSGLAG